jgi:tetratricopeptide (TPR) repeat protein
MNLSLPFPASWQIKHTSDGRVAAILPGPPGAELPDVVVTFAPLIVKPDDPRQWADQIARSDLPRGAVAKLGRSVDQTTHDGWPMRLVEAEVSIESRLIELRVCAMYTFLEHAVAVIVRAGNRERWQARSAELLELLAHGRPDWRAQPLCLADAWDLERPRAQQRTSVARASRPDFFEQELARLAAIETPTADDHVLRGVTLLALSRSEDALAAARAAIAIAPSERAHYLAGNALGAMGRHADAIVEWRAAREIEPRVDTHYNLGQAHYLLGDHAEALASFRAAHALDPSDVMLERKIIQCLYALGQYDEGDAARAHLRRAWSASRDPRVQAQVEYVLDQFQGDGPRVHTVEPLRQRDPVLTTLLIFRAVTEQDQPIGVEVRVETSEHAKRAGTPFVIGVKARGQFKVVATLEALPPYPELRARAVELLAQVLRPTPPT